MYLCVLWIYGPTTFFDAAFVDEKLLENTSKKTNDKSGHRSIEHYKLYAPTATPVTLADFDWDDNEDEADVSGDDEGDGAGESDMD
jgi:hypothetical protein